ncbi:MAG: STAS domain-containing protein [Alphaproteobacteria bacterium]|nr:STAS domain-containing protein [Alphaproteobacteria bacterium]
MNNGTKVKAAATVVLLPDRVDSSTSSAVEKLMMDALQPGARVIVDGSAIIYMSAAGVRALATVLHRAPEKQARLAFCRFSSAAADCLLVSGFTDLLDVVDTVEEASNRL